MKLSLTLVTAVALALFSSMATVASMMSGALSFRLFRLTVIAAVSLSVPSLAVTVRLKLGEVSKSRAVLLATVMAPVVALMLNAPPVLPAVMLYVMAVPSRSKSVPVKLSLTLITAVALALFSSIAIVASVMAGALSFRLLRLTVIAAVPLSYRRWPSLSG